MSLEPGLAVRLNWLLNHSLQAGLLVLLVMVVQWVFRRQLTSRWRFALWWIVLLRLLLPYSPESAVSVFNMFHPVVQLPGLTPPPPIPSIPSASAPSVPFQPPAEPATIDQSLEEVTLPGGVPESFQPITALPTDAGLAPVVTANPGHSRVSSDWLIPGMMGLWLGGVLVLTGVVAAQVIRFYRKLAPGSTPARAELRALLEECRREFGVARKIELLETDAVQSPALFGLFRLRLLLPRGIDAQFGRAELRYIFLHELAHVRRGDLWLNWLVTGLQVVHWFNPLLWLGFARLRADRELACDELALLRAGDHAGTAYGETVVKLLENLSRPAAIPGLVGILEDRQQMRRRISMIAGFRRPGRWSVLAALLLAALATAALTDAQTDKPTTPNPTPSGPTYDPYFIPENRVENLPSLQDMNDRIMLAANTPASHPNPAKFFVGNTVPYVSGTSYGGGPPRSHSENYESDNWETNAGDSPDLTGVVTAWDGTPLPVPATVFIVNAAPKAGAASLSSAYAADCGKQAQTDARGNFKIASLNPAMIFNVIVTAPGYQARYVYQVDPVHDHPVKAVLTPLCDPAAAPDRSLHGRVLDPQGKPIAGAVVEMRSAPMYDGEHSPIRSPFIDRLAVTDERGEFLITSKQSFARMAVKVSARNYAVKRFDGLPHGTTNDLRLATGVHLKGRVLENGRPVPDMVVGISDRDPLPPMFIDYYETRTDEKGNFDCSRLPADTDLQIYTLMNAMQSHGMAPIRWIHTRMDGETTDAGDLVIGPAHRLAGRVALKDGQPLPAGTKLIISRQQIWDSLRVPLDQNGGFEADTIPNETLSLSVRDYLVSADAMDPFHTNIMVDRDITNLVILLEKQPAAPKFDSPAEILEYAKTMHWVEPGADHTANWSIIGQILDRETKQLIASFLITPKHSRLFRQMSGDPARSVNGAKNLSLSFSSGGWAGLQLKAKADGYLPASITLAAQDTTNAVIELTKGSAPKETVAGSNGGPSARPSAANPRPFGPPGLGMHIPGEALNGVVLQPDGQPAVEAEVALEVNGRLLRIGQGAFASSENALMEGLLVRTGPDGGFTLPMYSGVESVVALSRAGYGRLTLEQVQRQSPIKLQPWGRIAGSLHHGRRLAAGAVVSLSTKYRETGDSGWFSNAGLQTAPEAYNTTTDDQGRFVLNFVPPGHQIISQGTGNSKDGWNYHQIATVEVESGAAARIDITNQSRQVLGKIKFSDGHTLTQRTGHVVSLISQEASMNSPTTYAPTRTLPVAVRLDGSFQIWDAPPGEYYLEVKEFGGGEVTQFHSTRPFVIPPVKDDPDEAAVNLGEILVTNVPSAFAEAMNGTPPAPKLISKGQLKGIVLLPDGTPAAGVDVALDVPGKPLVLGLKGFYPDSLREEGLITDTGPDGSFTLPRFDQAKTVAACSKAGFADVTMDQLNASPNINLQKWGRLEGTVFKGSHPDANEDVEAHSIAEPFSMEISHTRTDDQGRFVIDRVLPGEVQLSRTVSLDHSGPFPVQSSASLARMRLAPGQTFTTNIVRTGRLVTGQLNYNDPTRAELAKNMPDRYTPVWVYEEGGPEPVAGPAANHYYAVERVDGRLHAEDLPPGRFVIEVKEFVGGKIVTWKSTKPLVVPAAKDDDGETPVDWGQVDLTRTE